MPIEITRELAAKCLAVVDVGLVSGLGTPEPGAFCVEAAICYALGLPHGDDPGCVSPAVRALKIVLNDRHWSSPAARAKGLRRLALAQLGSRGTIDDREFIRRVVEVAVRKMVPIALRAAASIQKAPTHHDALLTAANKCEVEGTCASALEARDAAAAAYAAAAAAAAAADAAARDSVLSKFAEAVVQVLVGMNAPGTQWLDLAPLEVAA